MRSLDYAIVRVIPYVKQGEYINVGVILFYGHFAQHDKSPLKKGGSRKAAKSAKNLQYLGYPQTFVKIIEIFAALAALREKSPFCSGDPSF